MRSVSWIVAICLLLHGCSSRVMMKPRTYRPAEHGEPSCSGTYTPPAVDALIAVSLLALGAMGSKVAVDYGHDAPGTNNAEQVRIVGMAAAGIGFLAGGAAMVTSAYGVREARRCRAAHEDYRLHMQRTQGDSASHRTE